MVRKLVANQPGLKYGFAGSIPVPSAMYKVVTIREENGNRIQTTVYYSSWYNDVFDWIRMVAAILFVAPILWAFSKLRGRNCYNFRGSEEKIL